MTTTHPSAEAGTSQCAIILARLQSSPGEWVPMPTLARMAGGYAVHSRISDLRTRGHVIDHCNRRFGRKTHSFYRLSDSSPH